MSRHSLSLAIVGCLLALLPATAQTKLPTTLTEWATRAARFGKTIPQEQVFVHTDNTCYFLGDTLFYKAYVTRSDNSRPSNISGLLYAELLSPDGYLVERQLLELKEGAAEGSFCLPDTLYGGYYELRAYTRWQLNWGEYTHSHSSLMEHAFVNKHQQSLYFRDYDKLYSRVFPVYDKPEEPGAYLHDMTVRPLRRIYKADGAPPVATLTCYPEGGNLVAGVPCRIAFEANDDEGRHLKGSITIHDAKGDAVAEAKTDERGRGMATLTPKAGEKYKAEFVWEQGKASITLPKAEADGCAMQVTQAGGKVNILFNAQGAAKSEELGLTFMHNGSVLRFEALQQGQTSLALSTAEWPTGVIQATLFNAAGRIYADRLFFVRQKGFAAENLTFEGLDKQYAPFAPIEMTVAGGQPNATVSLAVRDAGHIEYLYDNASILVEMLLSSQIRGFVENPRYYFEQDDDSHAQALDLLLMVQGWRRHNWHTMAVPGLFILQHKPEYTQLMQGEVLVYKTSGPEDRLRSTPEQMGIIGPEVRESISKPQEDRDRMTGDQDANETNTLQEIITDAQLLRDRFTRTSTLPREMLMHAEFTKPGAEQGILGEVATENGRFSIESPRFYEKCYFFLGASDTTKWSKNKPHIWLEKNEDQNEQPNYPEYFVKLNPVYPRFVKPYNWYQSNLAEVPVGSAISPEWANDGSRTLGTVTVGATRNKLRKLDITKPAYVIDAYQAFNDACDAGFLQGVYLSAGSFADAIARTYIGDMNMDRQYEIEIRYDSHTPGFFTSDYERNQFNHLPNLENVYVYTDYSPRREGDKKFEQSNQPIVTIDLRRFANEGVRQVMRDRRYILQGYAVAEEFYQPDYSNKPLPEHKDYRRTLYWNAFLKLDGEGKAQVRFYNNGRHTPVAVSAEGVAADGTLMTGSFHPEDFNK